jgi:hypothetical protein
MALSVDLRGAAARCREGLQLLDSCFNEMGLLVSPGVVAPALREYLVRNPATGAVGLCRGAALLEEPGGGGASMNARARAAAAALRAEYEHPLGGLRRPPPVGTTVRIRSHDARGRRELENGFPRGIDAGANPQPSGPIVVRSGAPKPSREAGAARAKAPLSPEPKPLTPL